MPSTEHGPERVRRQYLSRPEREPFLVEELRRVFPASKHFTPAPGVVESLLDPAEATKVATVAFATQVLVNPEDVRAASISAWAELAVARVATELGESPEPWRLHVLGTEYPGSPLRRSRWEQVEETFRELLHRHHRGLARTRVTDAATPWAEGEVFFQLHLRTPTQGTWSVLRPVERSVVRRVLCRHPAGEVTVPELPDPPSRAYQKLLEAEEHLALPLQAGQTLVDLGASPGGWSYVALRRGLQVTAVDRSPLREDLMAHPDLRFTRGDAFAWKPPAPVDWMVCDVISYPERTVELLKTWLSRRWCRRFVVSVKFKGTEEYARLEEVKRVLKQNTWESCVRQLPTNRNEVTAMGQCVRPG